MMMKLKLSLLLWFFSLNVSAQINDTISETAIARIISFLASDSLKGRANYTPELQKAAEFIAGEFEKDSLQSYYTEGARSYFQSFTNLNLSDKESQPDSNGKFNPKKILMNVIGVLEGRSLPDEVIIFSAHYDHIGMKGGGKGDKIFNGANDDASGVAALLSLAHYYSFRKDNERTLVFCAFAAEELGLVGSGVFANKTNLDIKAVINIEMIGRHNITSKNSFFLTGSKYSNLFSIFKKNLIGYNAKIVDEKSKSPNLFMRSDNYPFALKGIAAHTIMCSDDTDPCYHQTCDDFKSIDIKNMTEIIRAIPVAMRTIVSGTDTPSKIKGDVGRND